MAEASWDLLYRPSDVDASADGGPRRSRFAFLLSWEAWLTLALLLLVQLPVVASLEATKWVKEMPSLVIASVIGLVGGWMLASTRGRALPLHLIGVATGFAVVVGEVMQSMRLADPLVASGVTARWSELWLRVGDWIDAGFTGASSSDPLPFVLLLVLLVWAIGYVSAWAVVRWQNAWAALVPAGFVLLTNISYLPGQPSFSFIVFLFAATLLVARMHFLQAMLRWRDEHAYMPDFMSLEVLFAGVWVGLVLVVAAWLIPTANHWGPVSDRWIALMQPVSERLDRVGRLFVGVSSKKPQPAHAFSDVFPLHGKIALSSNVLMSVVAPGPVDLVGAVYDEYTGSGWRVSSATRLPLLGTSVQAAQFGTPETRAQIRAAVPIQITSVSNDTPDRRLLTAGDALASNVDAQVIVGASPSDVIGLVPNNRVRKGEPYITVGTLSAAAAPTLLASGRNYPPEIAARYTQLPSGLGPDVGRLARSVTRNTNQPYEMATRVEQYLRDNYAYDLNVSDPPPLRDAVSYFLFDSKRGYFDYHASAMAVMLRTLGVPSRVVTGFALDDADINSATKAYDVSELRAWAWPEVYFQGLGWVAFNPTPARPAASRPADDAGLLQAAAQGQANADDALNQLLLDENEIDLGGSGARSAAKSDGFLGGVGLLVVRIVEIVLGIAVLLLTAAGVGRLAWEWEYRGLTAPVKRWAKIQRLASWAGIRTRNTRTPIESTRDLAAIVDEPNSLTRLAQAFTAERYGGRPRDEDEERAKQLDDDYARVQRRLGRLVIARLVPFRRRRGAAAGSALRGTPAPRR